MIINNARGGHSSPGVYTKEVDITYSVKSLGITSLGLAGETVKGPAFEPIKIEKWSEYVDYFGSTSAEKVKGTGYPKYELPYIAKEYLKESKQLYVCRALGLSGYDAGKAWVVRAKVGNKNYPVAILRSNGEYNAPSTEDCNQTSGDVISFVVTSVTIDDYSIKSYMGNCTGVTEVTGETDTTGRTITKDNLGRFTVKVNGDKEYPVSLNAGDKDYIYSVFGTNPFSNEAPLFVEAVYDYALLQMRMVTPSGTTMEIIKEQLVPNEGMFDYKEMFKCAVTPWIVSEVTAQKGSGNTYVATAKRLFRAYTISDGNNANTEVKLSIEKIDPEEGTFDLVVREIGDIDAYPHVLEKFANCNFIPGDKNYLPLRVGSYDGLYELKSKFIAIEMSENEELAGSVPAGFEGYPMNIIASCDTLTVGYNTEFDFNIKPKRQYFGFSNLTGIDYDLFSYKGASERIYKNSDEKLTAFTQEQKTVLSEGDTGSTLVKYLTKSNGFHMDSVIGTSDFNGSVKVDGTAMTFTSVSGADISGKGYRIPRIVDNMKDTIYEDINVRKFTVCFYGGFDGWDIYRKERTTANKFKATKYSGKAYSAFTEDVKFLNLPFNAINSDYYAYLGAYRQFSNPEDIDINVFATPGIDWWNNELLVEDALDVIEDTDDGRRGDALYIVTTPDKDAKTGLMYEPADVVDALDASSIDSSYAATYWPWVKYFDKDENVYVSLPVTKDVVRNLAYVDNTSYPWFAPAGMNRGDVNCVKASFKTRLADEDMLYDGRINPVKTFAADGVKIWGNKTMYSVDSPLNRINVRRLMLRIKKLITNVGKQLIFDQYDTSLKNQFLGLVTPILSNVKANGGIYDYKIDIDDSVEARDAHTLPCTIHVKPTPTLEYIDLTFTIYPESVDFRD